jgi:hypothetical protein
MKRCLSCGPVVAAAHCPGCGDLLLDPRDPADGELIQVLERQSVLRRRRGLQLVLFLVACLATVASYSMIEKVGPAGPGIAVCVFGLLAFVAMPRS